MKRWLAGVAVVALAASGCSYVVGDGSVSTDTLTLPAFSSVENTTQLRVKILPGTGANTLTIDANLHEYVRVEVVGGALKVDTTRWIVPTGTAALALYTDELTALTSSGSGDVIAANFGTVTELKIHSSGSGHVRYTGAPARLIVETSGSGSVTAEMSGDYVADLVRITSSGSGPVDSEGMPAHDLDVGSSGSGGVEARISNGALKIRLSGSGDVKWYGIAGSQDVEDTGSGSVVHIQ